MGYAYPCPVCSAFQADAAHLANHLAFTALLHGGDHEAWLAEHVPDWGDRDPDRLAATVSEYAEAVEHESTFEDAIETEVGHDYRDEGHRQRQTVLEDLDPETQRVVEEAVEMTRKRRGVDREE